MARSTKDQMCQLKKNQRQKVYKSQRKIRAALAQEKFSDLEYDPSSGTIFGNATKSARKEFGVINRRAQGQTRKLEEINHYIFKCGRRYAKAKVQKRRLQWRRGQIRQKLKNNFPADPNKLSKEQKLRKRKLTEQLRSIVDAETNLSSALDIVRNVVRGDLTTDLDEELGIVREQIPAWQIVSWIEEQLALKRKGKMRYNTVIIDSQKFDSSDALSIRIAGDQLQTEIMSYQWKTDTPVAYTTRDEINGIISVEGFDATFNRS